MGVIKFKSRQIYFRDKALSIHSIGGWVGPRGGLGDLDKSKSFDSVMARSPDLPVRSLVTIPTTVSRYDYT
jgi:hypothetical protein